MDDMQEASAEIGRDEVAARDSAPDSGPRVKKFGGRPRKKKRRGSLTMSFALSESMLEWLESEAKRRQISASGVIRLGIEALGFVEPENNSEISG